MSITFQINQNSESFTPWKIRSSQWIMLGYMALPGVKGLSGVVLFSKPEYFKVDLPVSHIFWIIVMKDQWACEIIFLKEDDIHF